MHVWYSYDGPSDFLCNKNCVVTKTSLPESTPNKHNAITYYIVHKSAAAGILEVTNEDTDKKLPMHLLNCFHLAGSRS